jgi:hypothetical protein
MTTNAKGNPRNKQEIQESAKHFAIPQPKYKNLILVRMQ